MDANRQSLEAKQMTLRQARILSSETDNTIKQEQNTNVNIKITPQNKQQRPSTVPLYPEVQPLNQNINFTQRPVGLRTSSEANPQMDTSQVGIVSDSQMMMTRQEAQPSMSGVNPEYQSVSPPVINRGFIESRADNGFQSQLVRDRGIADFGPKGT